MWTRRRFRWLRKKLPAKRRKIREATAHKLLLVRTTIEAIVERNVSCKYSTETCARAGGRGGDEILEARCILARAFFHEAAEIERPPCAQERLPTCLKQLPSGVPSSLHVTRNGTPNPHQNRPLIMPILKVRGVAFRKPFSGWVWPAKHCQI